MALADEARSLSSDVPTHQPRDGQPSVDWDGRRGTIATGVMDAPPKSWDDLIEDWELDPAEVQVVAGSVQIRAWDANVGAGQIERLRYYKATLEQRVRGGDATDIEALKAALMRRKPLRAREKSNTGAPDLCGTRIIPLADTQIGKEGTAERLEAIAASIDATAKTCSDHDRIVLAGMGDIIEQCDGHYPGQTFTVELDRREQMRVARRLILRAVDSLAKHAPLDVVCVPGNHGENRKDGKAFTRSSDNDDCAVFEQVADICASTDRYPDVRFGFPPDDDPLVATVDIDGTGVAFTHGHNLANGSTTQQKAMNWWKGQALGHRPAGDCDVLVTAHYHHLCMSEESGRLWLQMPALDIGSQWFTNRTGNDSPPGLLSFTVGDFGDRAWGDLTIS